MPSERTPLLHEEHGDKHHEPDVYDRFTRAQKSTIVALISMAGIAPFLIAGSFTPSIPTVARDLNTTSPIVNFAISLSVFAFSFGSLVWATYSKFYGRKPIYMIALTPQVIGSLGVANARTVTQLLGWRAIQASGASSGLSVGMGVIGDIYRLEERGTASGIFFGAILLGPTIAPLIGGVTSHFFSWRILQYGLGGYSSLVLVLTYFLQPETSQPGARGVDRLIGEKGKASWVWLNPFRCLAFLRSPNVLLLSFATSLFILTDFLIVVPVAYVFRAKYGISNEAIIGALTSPLGLGHLVGAPLSGMLSDRVIRWRKQRDGKWIAEDRLRAAIPGGLFVVPVAVLVCAFSMEFVGGTTGLVINGICYFVTGLGLDFVQSPSAAYNVDILHEHSSEVTAANMAFRNLFMAMAVSGILPAMNLLGIFNTYLVAVGLDLIACGIIWMIIQYGARMRAWKDIGYSTTDNE